jgi:hypothetical protein
VASRRWLAGGGLLLASIGLVALVVLLSAGASLGEDPEALARIDLPLTGGQVKSVTVVSGSHSRRIRVALRAGRVWPRELLPAHQQVTIDVVVQRAGPSAWLGGRLQHLRLKLTTPSASLRKHYLTLREGAPIELSFKQPVRMIALMESGHLERRVLARPRRTIRLPRTAQAGTLSVAAAPRAWETAAPTVVSFFPAGAAATAVANPAPGSTLLPQSTITLTFSKPVSAALGTARPPVVPTTPGTWHAVNAHTIAFRPEGYGYGVGTKVTVALPHGVRLAGGQPTSGSSAGSWNVPPGSPLRLQELLAALKYLPLRFHYDGARVPLTPQAQEGAAIHPPRGRFTWRYGNLPTSLRGFWKPGSAGAMTQGALMAFENDHGLNPDGAAGPKVWGALIQAALAGKVSHAGYSYVSVSVASQSLELWHNGHQVLTTAVNTGIASRPTATGTFPVYEHIAVGTMSGTNPDGSHYSDPGIKWISYFNGGDALHAFTRAQYGSPQSLGCVEMAEGPAAQVWPYTPIGTLVHVA